MRITALIAEKVHGYLPIRVSFHPDLTFLVGLNGSGKTTALRLLMGLLTPAFDELARLEFSSAEARINTGTEEVSVRAVRDGASLTLSVTGASEPLVLNAESLEWLTEPRRREESRAMPAVQLLREHPVYVRIHEISTPMFLGLDRRLFQEDRLGDGAAEAMRRREMLMRRGYLDETHAPFGVAGQGLAEVVMLVRDTMSEVRAQQEKLDEDLRQQLLLSAVRFRPSELTDIRPPTKAALDGYRARQAQLEYAASLLNLPVAEVQTSLQDFFAKMSDLLTRMEGMAKKGKSASVDAVAQATLSWLVNQSQVDRILENLERFESYARERAALHKPITRLLTLLNKFLVQSHKAVELASPDRLSVRLPDDRVCSVSALSSGERQLCVMLGHLALNKKLVGSGVFIVDEPELSLHLSWQEMFVDSVREANPDVQLIFATHSPAIILDKTEHCRSLGES